MKKISNLLEYIIFIIFAFLFRFLPFKISVSIGGFLGNLIYGLDRKHRKIAFNNLKESFKEKNNQEIKDIVKGLYRNIGKSFIEFIFLPRLNKEKLLKLIKIEGKENLEKAISKGKGVIVIVSHFGNWELVGSTCSLFGPSSAVAFPQSNKLTDKLINKYRKSTGLKILYTGGAIKELIKSLKRKEIIGLLSDQDAGGEGVFVEFFGRPASTHRGPVVLALKTEAPVVLTFLIREKNNTHRLVIEKELDLVKTGNLEKDVKINTTKWVKILEDYVRKYPEQWFWVHRRWKTKIEA
ncbi:MAG: lysophospholipid acyltransferase family protein [Candidatus Firestonebacteria bacterium]